MKTILHRADTRGHADHGWLNAHHSFSFANYYNPDRMNFGALRVLNDDIVSGGMGFGMHPHDNMEIITIPLRGDLEHKDSMGNTGRIKNGEIQVMSAGTGIFHSEYNPNKDKETNLLQIWLFPDKRNVEPRYDQISIEDYRKKNELYQVVSPDADDQGTWIHQDAWFHLGDFDKGTTRDYTLKKEGNGIYLFVIEGAVNVNGQSLGKRDAYGVWDTDKITVEAGSETQFLLMEVPMTV
ncbi:pirin family protein [Sinomicrobium pectinilyticum]|uniref:Pirin family protein n=1 Tax=Sinomicrobium pectinilyticum TaxID=1084421 RepID=A0A3N0EEM6_SINP1|nr:pirin family protein [Sinomicrobium pectinilyticum]RNL86322.1 pirin family protein [Sinomicrobium pectinilyticum]